MLDFVGLPQIVLLTVPVPVALLLLLVALYHLTPLLALLPNIHLIPLLHHLSTIIPSPKRNLPREFFNLPPRPTASDLPVLSIRGKVVLTVTLYSGLGLVCGWAFLASHAKTWYLCAIASTSVLSAVATLSVFTVARSSRLLRGVTHSTTFPRILPLSLPPIVLSTGLAAAGPIAVLIVASLLLAVTIACSFAGLRAPRRRIRLMTASANPDQSVVGESWLSSFSQPSEAHFSSFAYSPTPSLKTPRRVRTIGHDTPSSWLTSPTNTPDTIPSWNSSIASPHALHSPDVSVPRRAPKSSVATVNTTFTSPGGSIIGGYNPSPSNPPPRGFASLTSFPRSPVNSRVSLPPAIPEIAPSDLPRTRDSTYTSDTYYSEHTADRRAPPPPPMPVDMPLPPTPTAARSETAVEWGPYAKESSEFLVAERDWVEVDPDVDGLEKWSREGRGVGLVAVTGVVICYALSVPLLTTGFNSVTQILYLISLLLPPVFIAFASHLLRYRPALTTRQRAKKSSNRSHSTHLSSHPSNISLPQSLADELPEAPTRMSHLLQPKPSVSNFGYNRHVDNRAEEAYRKTMSRYSGDVWREAGHTVETNNRWSRVAEMIKPVPALAVLDHRKSRCLSPVIPSPAKSHRSADSASSQDVTEDFEGMTTMQSAEIQTAKKARSSSPMYFCSSSKGPAYELDWLTAGVLPGLVPNLRIGPDVLIGPTPSTSTHKSAHHDSIGTAPPGSPEMATPHRTHAHSSSVDFTSPNFAHATASTPHLRHRIKHKASFSLPTINPADFTDVRRSFDECGVDLPPVPAAYLELSRVSEGNESSLMRQTINEIAPAMLALAESPLGAILKASTSSLRSENETMAEEMERVMAMDTPTRAEFVISPPPSLCGRDSRASMRTTRSMDQIPAVPIIPQTTDIDHSDSSQFIDAEDVTHEPFQYAARPLSHPHPPPLPPVDFSRPNISIMRPHTPIPAAQLRSQRSSETISTIHTEHTGPHEPFEPSRREKERVEQLKQRAQIGKASKRQKNQKKPSVLGPLETEENRSFPSTAETLEPGKAPHTSTERSTKGGKLSTVSNGSGKENKPAKGSKKSMGSAGPKGLRA